MSKNWEKGEEIKAAGLNDTGFGFKVVAKDPASLVLRVNPGVALVDGQTVKFAGGDTPSFTAPTTNPRIDLVSVDSAGTIKTYQGSENVSPVASVYPAGETVLAEIYCRPGMTHIADNDKADGQGYIYRDSRPLGAAIVLIDEETADPDPANNAGKGVRLEANGKFSNEFIDFDARNILKSKPGEAMDGSTTPVAVFLKGGRFFMSEADVSARQRFSGFFKGVAIGARLPSIINGTSNNDDDNVDISSFVAEAGVRRYAIVSVSMGNGRTASTFSPVPPTAISWGGTPMTQIATINRRRAGSCIFGIPLGDNDSNDAPVNIVPTGYNWGGETSNNWLMSVVVYENVDQSDPIGAITQAQGEGSYNPSITPEGGNSILFQSITAESSTLTSGQTNIYGSSSRSCYLENVLHPGSSVAMNFSKSSTNNNHWASCIAEIRYDDDDDDDDVYIHGPLEFPTLSEGDVYYVSNTAGAISTSPGTQTIKVGKALSETQLFITE